MFRTRDQIKWALQNDRTRHSTREKKTRKATEKMGRQHQRVDRSRDQWQCAAMTPQVNLNFSFVSCVSKHLIEFRELILGIVVSAIAVFRLVDNILSSSLHC